MTKRILIAGSAGSGKTSLALHLEACFAKYCADERAAAFVNKHSNGALSLLPRRQDVRYGPNTIDVPAAYLDNTWAYQHLISLVQNDAYLVLMLASLNMPKMISAPGLTSAFACPVLGVITKTQVGEGIAANAAEVQVATRCLTDLGIKLPLYQVDLFDGKGIDALWQALPKTSLQEMRR